MIDVLDGCNENAQAKAAGALWSLTPNSQNVDVIREENSSSVPNFKVQSGHWRATGHFFGKSSWKILYTNLDLKRGWYRERPLSPAPVSPF